MKSIAAVNGSRRGATGSRATLLREELGHLWTLLEPLIQDDTGFPTILACCSTRPGEGTTTVITNLAILLGEQGIKTCIIEANLRRPALLKHFGKRTDIGLCDVLDGELTFEDVVIKNVAPGVDLVPAGSTSGEIYSVFKPEELREFLEAVTATYEIVLVDVPPLSTWAEAGIILGAARAAILVIEANRTRRHSANRSIATIKELGVPLLGVVLNRLTYEIPPAIERVL